MKTIHTNDRNTAASILAEHLVVIAMTTCSDAEASAMALHAAARMVNATLVETMTAEELAAYRERLSRLMAKVDESLALEGVGAARAGSN